MTNEIKKFFRIFVTFVRQICLPVFGALRRLYIRLVRYNKLNVFESSISDSVSPDRFGRPVKWVHKNKKLPRYKVRPTWSERYYLKERFYRMDKLIMFTNLEKPERNIPYRRPKIEI